MPQMRLARYVRSAHPFGAFLRTRTLGEDARLFTFTIAIVAARNSAGKYPLSHATFTVLVLTISWRRERVFLTMGERAVYPLSLENAERGGEAVKKGIHPEYVEAIVTCACGETWRTRSTKREIHLEVCSACHPFFTGKQKYVDSAGRVERFQKKYGQRPAGEAAG